MVLRHPPDRRRLSAALSALISSEPPEESPAASLPPEGAFQPEEPGPGGGARPKPSAAVLIALLVFALVVGLGTAAIGESYEPSAGGAAAPAAAPAPAPAKSVVLTFDDGPDPRYTPQILAILDRYGVKATFFVIGTEARRHPELIRALTQRGHSVQNHTWSHADLTKLSWSAFQRQVRDTDAQVRAAGGKQPGCLRPPYGTRGALLDRRAAGLGKRLVFWDVDSRDWTRPGVAAIQNRVATNARDGSVILFHDGGGNRAQTIAALPGVLKLLQASGFGFRTAACAKPVR
ncbi:polysaccharide deacetylase family protein [Kribbella italica]|uniref:Peptidoglycan/xylan/chitin deacetylase (PgdA/CDA1 family) n=1 Tax=Kribbella italica TaxID=1540520 RepID=A0A7W9MUP6_9ACTN|nr:polysaccharide deacetylase family protein [Kribbella italica]MBB5836954.1 peptidoglycan/xylan/chitin deacetylase (PgdA/CDA1 family) [Kribbella italica]